MEGKFKWTDDRIKAILDIFLKQDYHKALVCLQFGIRFLFILTSIHVHVISQYNVIIFVNIAAFHVNAYFG